MKINRLTFMYSTIQTMIQGQYLSLKMLSNTSDYSLLQQRGGARSARGLAERGESEDKL